MKEWIGSLVCHIWWENYNGKHCRSVTEFNVWHLCTRFSMARWRCQPNWLTWNYLYVQAEETINNRSCIKLDHTLLNTRNPSYTGQSQSGILFLHQLLNPTQYLPSSVGSPLFRRAKPEIASGSWRLLSRSRSSCELYGMKCSLKLCGMTEQWNADGTTKLGLK